MENSFKILISAILSGVAISIGGIAFLCTKQAIFFPIGLLIVCLYKLNLFTGKVPYAKIHDIQKLLLVFIGNIFGSFITGIIIGIAKPTLVTVATDICKNKLNEGFGLIPLAILCNVMIFIAVDVFKNEDILLLTRVFVLWMATSIFVICGFEHCIANAFYFSLARIINIKSFIYIINNMIFNAVGGILIYHILSYMIDGDTIKNNI